jgi:hypothetical protein
VTPDEGRREDRGFFQSCISKKNSRAGVFLSILQCPLHRRHSATSLLLARFPKASGHLWDPAGSLVGRQHLRDATSEKVPSPHSHSLARWPLMCKHNIHRKHLGAHRVCQALFSGTFKHSLFYLQHLSEASINTIPIPS